MRVLFRSAIGAAGYKAPQQRRSSASPYGLRDRYSSLLELGGRELDERLLVLRVLRVDRELEELGALRVGSSEAPSRAGDEDRVVRPREGGGLEELFELGSFARRFGRLSSAGAARRTGVSQYGQTDQRGSIGLPQDSHGSLIRARQFGQRR
jgi:hypothetical protein